MGINLMRELGFVDSDPKVQAARAEAVEPLAWITELNYLYILSNGASIDERLKASIAELAEWSYNIVLTKEDLEQHSKNLWVRPDVLDREDGWFPWEVSYEYEPDWTRLLRVDLELFHN